MVKAYMEHAFDHIQQHEQQDEMHYNPTLQYPSVPNSFFVDGLGGTEKTFLSHTLLYAIRSQR